MASVRIDFKKTSGRIKPMIALWQKIRSALIFHSILFIISRSSFDKYLIIKNFVGDTHRQFFYSSCDKIK